MQLSLYVSLHCQIYGIQIVMSLQVMISVHMSFLQLVDIESATSQQL